MLDKNLLELLGNNKKYIYYTVAWMIFGLLVNISVTAAICYAVFLAVNYDIYSGGAIIFVAPGICALAGITVRYISSRLVGDMKDILGRKAKKELREKVYCKILSLGVRATDGRINADFYGGRGAVRPILFFLYSAVFLFYAGTGAMLHLLSRDCPGNNYTGLDLSEKMIEVAKRKQIKGLNFVVGDCEELSFADESFDVVTCSMSFHHYPNPEKFFANLKKVLRPGGRFILRDMTSRSKLNLWFINHIELPFFNAVAGRGDVHCYSKDDIQKFCDRSGLVLEKFEVRKGFRLHCVIRKAKG